MATRANTLVYKNGLLKAILYYHYDGYPEGQGASMKKHLSTIIPGTCGCEPYFVINDLLHGAIKYTDGEKMEMNWTDNIHGDIDYLYIISCNSKKVKGFDDEEYDQFQTPTIKCLQRCGATIDKPIIKDFSKGWREVEIPTL